MGHQRAFAAMPETVGELEFEVEDVQFGMGLYERHPFGVGADFFSGQFAFAEHGHPGAAVEKHPGGPAVDAALENGQARIDEVEEVFCFRQFEVFIRNGERIAAQKAVESVRRIENRRDVAPVGHPEVDERGEELPGHHIDCQRSDPAVGGSRIPAARVAEESGVDIGNDQGKILELVEKYFHCG